jgi:uncharacterized protein (TIGR02145 family)
LSCPDGWHLPKDKEWEILVTYLGGNVKACNKLKSQKSCMENYGTNESDFNTVGGGMKKKDGSY